MDRIFGYLAMAYIFLPWRPIVVLVAAIFWVNISGAELYGLWRLPATSGVYELYEAGAWGLSQ